MATQVFSNKDVTKMTQPEHVRIVDFEKEQKIEEITQILRAFSYQELSCLQEGFEVIREHRSISFFEK